ncbi:sigma factor-like helix-turn-helix DNA-binding protein [Asanoa sp. NPDC049518]|uniref:sigma factor-like helix-turn-helix DNA-binding protein n=1 Tax=unclassified Asanoa TaxID=2685164 RepID=UPI003439C0EB
MANELGEKPAPVHRAQRVDGVAKKCVVQSVTLRDVLGLRCREIAELQAVPEGTVKERIHEARRRLRERLTIAGAPVGGKAA